MTKCDFLYIFIMGLHYLAGDPEQGLRLSFSLVLGLEFVACSPNAVNAANTICAV